MPAFTAPQGTPTEWAACHSSPHWLDPIAVPADQRHGNGVVDVWYRCVRCGTERYDQHDGTTLELVGRRYAWPDGYRTTRSDMPDRVAWKATYLQMVGVITPRQAGGVRHYRHDLWQQTHE